MTHDIKVDKAWFDNLLQKMIKAEPLPLEKLRAQRGSKRKAEQDEVRIAAYRPTKKD